MPSNGVWFRIVTLARAVLHDLFGEGDDSGPGEAPRGSGLDEIQARLDGLMPELAGLAGRQKQLEAEQRRAAEELAALDAEIDAAAQQNDDDRARALLQKRLARVARMEELEQRCVELAQAVNDTRASVDALRARLAEARRQAADLSAREQSASALENLARTRRALDRDLGHLQEDFARRGAQAAKTEDWVAAIKEVEKKGKE